MKETVGADVARSLRFFQHVYGPLPAKLGSYAITVDAGATRESLVCALRSTEPGGDCTSEIFH